MKRIFSLVFFLFSAVIIAQSTHKEAKELLHKTSEQIKKSPAIEIEFQYQLENPRIDASKQTEEGKIVIAGERYQLYFMGMEQLFDGKMMYNILEDIEEVQVVEPDEEEALTPSRILSLHQDGYSYKMAGTQKINGRPVQHIMMKANKSAEIDYIEVLIFTDKNEIHQLIQKGHNGSITTFSVKKYKTFTASNAPKITFDKSKYPGYVIIE